MIFRWLPLGHLHLNGRNVDRSRVFALENGRLWMEAREGCKTNGHVYNIWQPVISFYFYCWRACFSRKKLVGKVPFIHATLGRAWRRFSNRDQGTTGMKKCLNTISLAQHKVHFPFRMFLFLIYGGLLCYSIPYLSEKITYSSYVETRYGWKAKEFSQYQTITGFVQFFGGLLSSFSLQVDM